MFNQLEDDELDPITGMPKNPILDLRKVIASPNTSPEMRAAATKKMGVNDYSPEARQAIVDQNSGFDTGGVLGGALASLGAAFQGKDSMAAANGILNRRRAMQNDRLDQFDKGRANAVQDISLNREMKKDERQDSTQAREDDINSEESKMANELAQRIGYKGNPVTATRFKNFSPVMEKMYEAEQKRLDRQDARADRNFLVNTVRSEKREKEARLDDKQVSSVTDLENAESDLNNLMGQLGKKSNWTGPLDGRIPDALVGEDQVAWRSALGKYKDAYRKAVTGAGASNAEIARLESRLPSESDTFANFKAKANEALGEIGRRKQTLLGNYGKMGKDVAKYSTSPQPMVASTGKGVPPRPKTVIQNGNTYTLNPETGEYE